MRRDRVLTTAEAAKVLHTSRRTVARMIESGRLKAIRIGSANSRGQHRILRSDIFKLFGEEGK